MQNLTAPIEIVDYVDIVRREGGVTAGIDRIFWETASARFDTEAARAAFHDLWLGQYLRHEPGLCSLAMTADGRVVGYIVGCLDNPARSQRFASLTYFQKFADACGAYPAHLHINLDATVRNRGIGQRLIERFAAQVTEAGLPGLHVVTGAGLRNVRFYERCGFAEVGKTPHRNGEVVVLGRKTPS